MHHVYDSDVSLNAVPTYDVNRHSGAETKKYVYASVHMIQGHL